VRAQTTTTTTKKPKSLAGQATTAADYDSVKIGQDTRKSTCRPSPDVSFYDFNATLTNGDNRNFSVYQGEVIVVVNVATYWGYTRQYKDFNKILDQNAAKGLRFLAFPCNQFNLEEQGDNDEIINGVMHVRPGHGYVPHKNIKFFEKVNVNGDGEHPLFTWLKSVCPPTDVSFTGTTDELRYNPLKATDLMWNFEKFLIDRQGQPRFRFHPGHWDYGSLVEPYFQTLLAEPAKNWPLTSGASRRL